MRKHRLEEGKRHLALMRAIDSLDHQIAIKSYAKNSDWRALQNLQAEREKLVAELDQLTPGRITVSDHALIRYIERVLKVDLDEVRRSMLNEKQRAIVSEFKSCVLPLGSKMYAVVKNRVVVSVVPAKRPSDRLVRAPKSKPYKKEAQQKEACLD